MTPSLLNLPAGCAFRSRCPRADISCALEPPVHQADRGRKVRCFHPHEGESAEEAQAAEQAARQEVSL